MNLTSIIPDFEILAGPSGSGKTHALRALEREALRECPAARVLRCSAAELVARLVAALHAGDLGAWRALPDAGLVRGAVNKLHSERCAPVRILF